MGRDAGADDCLTPSVFDIDAYACPLATILADSEPLVTYFAFACIQFAFGMCSLSLAFSFLSCPGIPRTRKRHARRHRSTYHPLQPRNLTRKHVACPTIPSVTTSFDRATPGNDSINTAPRTRRDARNRSGKPGKPARSPCERNMLMS